MKCSIYDAVGMTKFLRIEEIEPVCGKDFCEHCGTCLACNSEDPCVEDSHFFVRYEEDTK